MNDVLRLYRDVLRTDYCAYVKHTNNGYKVSKFHRFLCDTVQDFLEEDTGHAYDILILSTPPQHGKSVTVTETLPSWYLGRNPEKSVIEISYSEDFAQKFGRRNLQKIKEFGGEVFGVKIGSPANATEFELEGHRGGMVSRGLLSGVTGRRCDLMIIDDPVKTQQEADSESYRNRVFDEWLSSYKTRLYAGAKIILIMTRWHEDDLAGRLIETEQNVKVVNIPLEAEPDDILGRKVGDALCPEIGKDNVWLADFKKSYTNLSGSRAWNALFQGHPTGLEGNIIKREWWQYYETLPHIEKMAMSVDAAFKDGDDNDFVAIQVWGKTNADIYLMDAVKKHLDMPATIREITRLRAMYPQCKTTYIEDKANGSAIIKYLRTHMGGVIAVNPEGGKVSRVNAVIGTIESGNCFLPKNKPFTGDFVEECAAFPNGKHDDQVDCMSQVLNKLIYSDAKVIVAKEESFLERNFPALKKKKGKRFDKGDKIHVI